jgi:hypothetical protein
MQQVLDEVDNSYLQQAPPRPLPIMIVIDLLADRFLERPAGAFLNPVLIINLIALVVLAMLRMPPLLLLIPFTLIIFRLMMSAYRTWLRVADDLTLLQQGLLIGAYVLKMRPHRSLNGEIDGVLLDCALPVALRRTYVGSIWLSDPNEALRLAHQGRVEVVCLPRTPGTWRVAEEVRCDVRYERTAVMWREPEEEVKG